MDDKNLEKVQEEQEGLDLSKDSIDESVDNDLSKPKKRVWINILLIAIITALVMILFISDPDVDMVDVIEILKTSNLSFILLGLLAMFVYWIFTDLALFFIAKKEAGGNLNTFKALNVCNCVYFYNGITPFAAGGQPFQIYYYRTMGIKSAKGAGIVMTNFIIYQITITAISIIMLLLYNDILFTTLSAELWGIPMSVMIVLGFIINVSVLAVLVLSSISGKFKNLCLKITRLVVKIKFLRKRSERIYNKAEKFLVDFQESFKGMFKKKITLMTSVFLQVFAQFAYYSVAFFVVCAINPTFTIEKWPLVLALGSFALTVMAWIPTPGATGGAEWAFSALFTTAVLGIVIAPETATAGILLWRLLTYYLSLIQGYVSVFILNNMRGKKEKKICA